MPASPVTTAWSRRSRPIPASAGTRWPPGPIPSEHGSTNNTFFRAGDAFNNRTSFSGAGVLQADTIANAAERAGKKVAQIDWVAGAAADIQGPTVDFTNFFSNRGVLVGAADPVEQAGSAFFGVTYQPATLGGAEWLVGRARGRSRGAAEADDLAHPDHGLRERWHRHSDSLVRDPTPPINCTNVNRTYNVYFYDSVVDGKVATTTRS